ncbi:MAG: hypothetical protein Q4G16_11125, partial [Cruoricaptor ignavus]|nr:hypothetical protein [Cruoricaptor ignavus]
LGFERENVTIKNPKDITFAYDRENKILKAKAKNTLIIENKKLGYYVEYNLINFSIDDGLKMSSYSGTSLFKEMRGGKTKQLEWQANRLNAYYGSAMHFFRSAFNHRVNDEGFIVNHIVEIPNPKYPSKEELQKSEEYFRSLKNKNDGKNPFVVSKEIQEIEWRKRNESEFSLALVEHKIASEKFITKDIHGTFFAFKDLLGIVYQKFPFNINKGVITKATIPINTSSIINTYGNIFELSEDGNYTNPDQMIFMDDWAKQKFSTLLPLDYTPDR